MATRVAARLAAEGGGRSLELFHPAIRSPRQRRWETCADMAPISSEGSQATSYGDLLLLTFDLALQGT